MVCDGGAGSFNRTIRQCSFKISTDNANYVFNKTKGIFSRLLTVGRCVIPADKYYEWEKVGQEKMKHFVKDGEGNLLFMAGLYQDTTDGREFVIKTKEIVGDITKIPNRMPVVIRAEQIEIWLNGNLSPDEITRMDFSANVAPCKEDFYQMGLQ